MRKIDCWELVSMVVVLRQWKRRCKSVEINIYSDTSTKNDIKHFYRNPEEEKEATTCSQNHTSRFRPFFGRFRLFHNCRILICCAILISITAMVYCVIFMGSTTEMKSGLIITRQNINRLKLPFHNASPFVVTASTVTSTVSRFDRHLVGCKSHNEVFGVVSESITRKQASLHFLIEKVRGGSQHDYSQQSKSIRRNYHSYSDRESNVEKEPDPEFPIVKNNSKEKSTNNPLLHLFQSRNRVSQAVRQGTGAMFSLFGFLGSSFVSFATDRRPFEDRFVEPIRALNNFLKTSGVDDELSKSLNPRLGVNLCLLGRVHLYQAAEELAARIAEPKKYGRRRIVKKLDSILPYKNLYSSLSSSSKINHSFLEEARRYMRYATAVYGQAMINAAEVDARGRLDGKVGRVSKETISTHILVPAKDIVSMDVSNYDGDSNYLRHMVVVDHEHRKVVLSIRGTFSLEEIVLDVAAFSREFCGGEAHSEMANMAERVWTVAGPTVQSVLEENPGYEFILTGHSLGAGAACLLTILVQSKRLLPKEQEIRCFAYASPPVYTPLEFVPKSVRSTTNFVHQNDFVPFLSIQKVRKLLSSLQAVDLYARNNMSKKEKYKVVLGAMEPPIDLIAAVLEAEGKRLIPKKGAPNLYIPAEHTVLLREIPNKETNGKSSYYYSLSNAREMSQREIRVYPDMLVDHSPARYEYAFDHLEKQVEDEK